MDVDTDPFLFDQMRNQLNGIQQANSNYEENKSSCSRSHSSTQIFEKKGEESPDSKPKSWHAENENLWANIFKIIETTRFNKRLPSFDFEEKTVFNNFEKLRTKGIIIRKIGSGRKSRLTIDLEINLAKFFMMTATWMFPKLKMNLVFKESKLIWGN